MGFDWKQTLSAVAPTLASALGGPMAGVAVSMGLKKLGVTPTGDEGQDQDTLAQAVASGNPETLLRLKEVEAEFKLEMKRLDVDLEQIHAGDRASARDMAKAKGLVPQAILSAIFVAAFATLLFLMFKSEVSDQMQQPFNILLGILSAGMTQILNFWFGSSAGSARKNETIEKMRGAK